MFRRRAELLDDVAKAVERPAYRYLRAQRRSLPGNRSRRFDGLSLTHEKSGAVLLDGAMAWMECEIAHTYAAGDHSIVVFTIRSTMTDDSAAPLVLHRSSYHEARAILMPESR